MRGPPAFTEPGFNEIRVGAAMNVSGCAIETVVSEFNTTIDACEATLTVGTVAVKLVLLTNLVGSALPFISTTAPLANPAPVTRNVNAAVPTVRTLGLKAVMVGFTWKLKLAV
jgi:hypothetical protein